jgi:hypothetical protein
MLACLIMTVMDVPDEDKTERISAEAGDYRGSAGKLSSLAGTDLLLFATSRLRTSW